MHDSRRGVFNPVLPLDVVILKVLPKEGSMFMRVYPEAASVTDIKKAVVDGALETSLLATRLRVMHQFQLVVSVAVPRSPTAGWQITKKGEQFIRDNDTPEVSDGS